MIVSPAKEMDDGQAVRVKVQAQFWTRAGSGT